MLKVEVVGARKKKMDPGDLDNRPRRCKLSLDSLDPDSAVRLD